MIWDRHRAAPLIVLVLVLLVAPYFVGDPLATAPSMQLTPPGFAYPLGSDLLGRDMLARTVYGGQRTLMSAGAATAIAVGGALCLTGIVVVTPPGGRRWLRLLTRTLLALPPLVFGLIIVTLTSGGEWGVIAATGLVHLAPYVRVLDTSETSARQNGHVEAARALGAGEWRVWRAHLLPIMLPTLLAQAGVTFAGAILTSAALGFLGFGGEVSAPEWGRMLYDGRQVLRVAPWVPLAPGVGITLLVMSVNYALESGERRVRRWRE